MNRCIICNVQIKEDHVYCLDCYLKLDKSEALKKCKEYYIENKSNLINVFDNYNNSLKYFPSIVCFETYISKVDFSDFKITRKPAINDKNLSSVLELNKSNFEKLNLNHEYSSLSYLDSLWALNEAFKLVEDKYIKNNTSIYMEYLIPNLEMQRIDYLLVCNNKIMFIEFGQSDVLELSELSDVKKKQLDEYVYAIKKEFPVFKNKNIIKEIFVYKSDGESVNKSINHLAKMINIHFGERMPKDILNLPR